MKKGYEDITLRKEMKEEDEAKSIWHSWNALGHFGRQFWHTRVAAGQRHAPRAVVNFGPPVVLTYGIDRNSRLVGSQHRVGALPKGGPKTWQQNRKEGKKQAMGLRFHERGS